MVTSSSSLTGLRALLGGRAAEPARVAQEFEALVLGAILRSGTKPMLGPGLLDGGSAGRMAQEQLLTELAMRVSRGGGLGLARDLERQMQAGAEGGAS